MIKSAITLSQAKATIKKMQQKQVEVTINLGRNKFVNFFGTVSGIYPALFTVLPTDKNFKGKTSYSYSEYMCGRVKLKETATNREENTI
jgi:uncharacterized protein Veg